MAARVSRPARATETPRAARRPKRANQRRKSRNQPRRPDGETKGFRFDDPYWDDAFDSYYDPTLRTCCRI